jgi:hypothetical protein
MKKRKVRSIIWRLFHRKKRRVSDRALKRLMGIHLRVHQEMIARERGEGLIIDGKLYEAAVEKYEEGMMVECVIKTQGVLEMGEAPLTKTDILDDIPAVRCSNIPKLLLLLGVRIKG